MEDIPLIAASGSSFECGETVGRSLGDEIDANIAGYMEIFARYMPPTAPGYSITMRPESLRDYEYPYGSVWR